MRRIISALLLVAAPSISLADANIFAGYASGAHDGLELEIGYVKNFGNASITVNYLAGVIYSGEAPSGYREETFSNGNTVCRDLSNGQFAKKEKCDPTIEAEYAPSIEASYWLAERVSIGAGYRGGDEPEAIGTLAYKLGPKGYASIRGGSEYFGIGFGALF